MRRHNKAIEVQWGHWSGAAVYLGPPVHATAWWAEPKRGKFEALPPKKVVSFRDHHNGELIEAPASWLERNGWGREPQAWRPRAGDVWPDPLPEPISITPSPEGRAVRIDHVAFSAADAAAEMEAERQWRRDRGDDGEAVAVDAWWRDGTLITYSEPGSITPRECEGRIMRALYWLGRGGDRLVACTDSPLAKMVADTISSEHIPDTRELPPLARMPNESDARIMQAMAWLTEMLTRSRHRQKIAERWLKLLLVLTRDNRVLMTHAGAAIGTTLQNATAMQKKALRLLTLIANTGTPTIARNHAAIVARNREHARAGAH